jgi:hypothetical protein
VVLVVIVAAAADNVAAFELIIALLQPVTSQV